MPKGSEDYRKGKLLPDPVVPASTICFHITIPNAVQYRAALVGVISQLSNWYTWDHPTDGTECVNCNTAAEMFAKAIEESYFDEECGDDMSCADVADCIENDPLVKQALDNIVPSVPIDGMVFPPGAPLTPSQMTMRLNEIDACAFDPYWAQVEQYVDYMIDLGQDVLDQLALYSAALDAGENIPMGKFLGKLKNSSTAGKVIEFLQWVLTTVKAAYEAADNAANRDAIKCAIFCQFRDDCLITIQGTLDVLNERNGGLLTPGDLTDLLSMVDAFMAAAFNPALALDLWLMFLMGSAKTAGMFGLQGIDETIQMVLAVAVNDANNDWETKCDDCAEPEGNLNIVPLSGWAAFVNTAFVEMDGLLEIWDISVLSGALGVWTSYACIDSEGRDFTIDHYVIQFGTWLEKGEIDGVNYPSGLPNNVVPVDYFAQFSTSWPARMRVWLNPQ
jgi:hypothetical protein